MLDAAHDVVRVLLDEPVVSLARPSTTRPSLRVEIAPKTATPSRPAGFRPLCVTASVTIGTTLDSDNTILVLRLLAPDAT